MKYLIPVFLILFSCQSPVEVKHDKPLDAPPVVITQARHVVNSLWQEIPMETVNAQGRSISTRSAGVNLEANVAAYNAANTGDQWFIIDGDIPGIDEAPLANAFVVDRVTHVPLTYDDGNGTGTLLPLSFYNIPRRELVENYLGWVQYANNSGGVLYVDVIPPAPLPPTEEQYFAAHQVYVVNGVGIILYHFDCTIVPEGFEPMTPDQYYAFTVSYANQIVLSDGNNAPDGPWHVVYGYVYTEPS